MTIASNDNRKIRCRMLGHEVSFGYCRQGSGELPCRAVFDCWFEIFEVEQFLRKYYTDDQIAKILTPPQPKMASLLDLIRKAQSSQ